MTTTGKATASCALSATGKGRASCTVTISGEGTASFKVKGSGGTTASFSATVTNDVNPSAYANGIDGEVERSTGTACGKIAASCEAKENGEAAAWGSMTVVEETTASYDATVDGRATASVEATVTGNKSSQSEMKSTDEATTPHVSMVNDDSTLIEMTMDRTDHDGQDVSDSTSSDTLPMDKYTTNLALAQYLKTDYAPVFIVEHHDNGVKHINGHRDKCSYLGGFAKYRRAYHKSSHCIMPSARQVYIWNGLQRDNHFTLLKFKYKAYRAEMIASGYSFRLATEARGPEVQREIVEYDSETPYHFSESLGVVVNESGIDGDEIILRHFESINFQFYHKILTSGTLKGLIKTERSVDRFDFGYAMLNQRDSKTLLGFNLPEITKALDKFEGSLPNVSLSKDCVHSMTELTGLYSRIQRMSNRPEGHPNKGRNKMFAQRLVEAKGGASLRDKVNLFDGMSVGLSNHTKIKGSERKKVTLSNHYDHFNDARSGYDGNITSICFLNHNGSMHRMAVNAYNKHGCGLGYEKSQRTASLLAYLKDAKRTMMTGRWSFRPDILSFPPESNEYKFIPAIADKNLNYSFHVGTILELADKICYNLFMLMEIIYCTYIMADPIGWREGVKLALSKGDPNKSIVENFCELLCTKDKKSISSGEVHRFSTFAARSCSMMQIYMSLFNMLTICRNGDSYKSTKDFVRDMTKSVYKGGVKLAGDVLAHQTVAILCRLFVMTNKNLIDDANFCNDNGTARYLSDEWGFFTRKQRESLMVHLKEKLGWSATFVENAVFLVGVDGKFQDSDSSEKKKKMLFFGV